ncbi:MAG: nucleotidyltransferase family protein [Oceanibaculum nanhaiense]|uniref:nucleotidyltransferase family protein n=1 Tax=Oceanibaculum nanhaiense TaxID=1909734 RepID=UPI0025A31C28|nr:nucleotidyltransferase family protein [Oceanibaculum nanhaiense]MDM7947756.1 nucleotidyltransferase family protein [Oceanibaculum nanhaiense]
MVSLENPPLPPEATLRDAVGAIEATHRRLAVVADADGTLLGTVTDGDIRRGLLRGLTLEDGVSGIMNKTPTTAHIDSDRIYLLELLVNRRLESLPLVDSQGRYRAVISRYDLGSLPEGTAEKQRSGIALAVIMAGGEGQRLRPMTETLPKPMVDIGGMPLIERIVRTLIDAGVPRICIAVNYLRHVIQQHFGDGSALGGRIDYLQEESKLGTAGALSLLPEAPDGPILVMNGDVLTRFDCNALQRFHAEHGAAITVAGMEYRVDIPYGVIQSSGAQVTGLAEKPSQRFLCNAGIYMLDPSLLAEIPRDTPFDMTDLIARCLAGGQPVCLFPLHEYWADIGTPDDLAKARRALLKLE